MTKMEYEICEKYVREAIKKAKQANEEYQELDKVHGLEKEIKRREADQHYGEAFGLARILFSLKFSHDDVKELWELVF